MFAARRDLTEWETALSAASLAADELGGAGLGADVVLPDPLLPELPAPFNSPTAQPCNAAAAANGNRALASATLT